MDNCKACVGATCALKGMHEALLGHVYMCITTFLYSTQPCGDTHVQGMHTLSGMLGPRILLVTQRALDMQL